MKHFAGSATSGMHEGYTAAMRAAAVQRKQPVTPGRCRRAEPENLSAGQRPFVCAGNRPKPSIRLARLASDEQSFAQVT